MILDLRSFAAKQKPQWDRLEKLVDDLQSRTGGDLPLPEARELHYLYERCSADLARLGSFRSDSPAVRYLSSIVARAYAEIYETRDRNSGLRAKEWLGETLPQTFRRHIAAWYLALLMTLAGSVFGAAALAVDPEAKNIIMPFRHLLGEPAARVKAEESGLSRGLAGRQSSFSAQLMTHNIRVSIFVLALGITWGLGSSALLFYNGVVLGAVAFDYIQAGYGIFLLGWLLPHGSIEIPAILISGQAAMVLASALIGSGGSRSRRQRLRQIVPDVATLAGGVAILLIWAGLIESFVSQFHQPVLPYMVKIALGCLEGLLLWAWLRSGKRGGARVVR